MKSEENLEEFRIKPGFRGWYTFISVMLIIGIISTLFDSDETALVKVFTVLILSMFASSLLYLGKESKITIDESHITRKLWIGKEHILLSEIKNMTLKPVIRNMFQIGKSFKYNLKLELKDKTITFSSIYYYENADKLLELLEKKTGKKIEGKK